MTSELRTRLKLLVDERVRAGIPGPDVRERHFGSATLETYKQGCRCADCRETQNAYRRRLRARTSVKATAA